MTDYRAVNLASWNDRAPPHACSADCSVARFAEDPTFLSDVVRFDRLLLGDISGLRGVHLQCHIGTDTISLARLGATMTGLDFSAAALAEARQPAGGVGAAAEFVRADVCDAVKVRGDGRFDLVFTGIGALCWLPSIRRWADVVGGLLRPGGRLFLREGHPCCGRWLTPGPMACWPWSTPTSSVTSQPSGPRGAPTSRQTRSSRRT